MNWTVDISEEAVEAVKAVGYLDPTANHELESYEASKAHSILGAEIFLSRNHACSVRVQVPEGIMTSFREHYAAYKLVLAEMEAIHPQNSPGISVEEYDRKKDELDALAAPLRSKLYSLEMVLVSIVQAQV